MFLKRLDYFLKSKTQEIPVLVAASLNSVTCWVLIRPLGLCGSSSVRSRVGTEPSWTPPPPQPEVPAPLPAARHFRVPFGERTSFSSCPPSASHGVG